MCFKSKMKQPKVSDQQAAPQPMLLEAPKGAEFGDGADDTTDKGETTSGLKSLKIDKATVETGEGSQAATASDTGASKVTPIKKSPAVKRALKR
jgi:hypothetical protein